MTTAAPEIGPQIAIQSALWRRYRRKPACVAALVELEADRQAGTVRPTREYARLWGMGRKQARTLIDVWKRHTPKAEHERPTERRPIPIGSVDLDTITQDMPAQQCSAGDQQGPTRDRPSIRKVKDLHSVRSEKGPLQAHN